MFAHFDLGNMNPSLSTQCVLQIVAPKMPRHISKARNKNRNNETQPFSNLITYYKLLALFFQPYAQVSNFLPLAPNMNSRAINIPIVYNRRREIYFPESFLDILN